MDTILPSELPYVIGFIAVVLAVLWLIGRAADRGMLSGPMHPVFAMGISLLFAIASVLDALSGQWWVAAFYAFGCCYFAFVAWRRWQRT